MPRALQAFMHEVQAHQRFADAGVAQQGGGRALGHAAVGQLVPAGNAEAEPLARRRRHRHRHRAHRLQARVDRHAVLTDLEHVAAQQVLAAAQLEYLDLADQLHAALELAQFDQAVDQGVLRVGQVAFGGRQQEGGALHGRHQRVQRQHEFGQGHVGRPRFAYRAEAVDDHDVRAQFTQGGGDRFQQLAQAALEQVAVGADELDVFADQVFVEKREVAEMVEHLAVGFGDQRQDQDFLALAGVLEGDLAGQCGLAAAGQALDQIDAMRGKTAAEDLVEAGNAGAQQGDALCSTCVHGARLCMRQRHTLSQTQ
jgi:hypothetical protein